MNFTRMPARLVCTLLVVTCLGLAVPSHAYRMSYITGTGPTVGGARVACSNQDGFAHWITTNLAWYHNTGGQGAGKAAALFNGMNVWTFIPNNMADYFLTYRGTTTAGFIPNDSSNTVVWATDSRCTAANNCIALTMLYISSGQVIQEADIMFRSDLSWSTTGGVYDVWATASHEFGHTLGIHHTELGPGPTMHIDYNFGWRDLAQDDIEALLCLNAIYGSATNKTCVPNGGVDDSGYNTSCCSGLAVTGSQYCPPGFPCHHICATPLVNGCVPSGGVDDTLSNTRCCSGAAVSGSTRCLNPADYTNGTWKTCVHTCA